MYMYMYYGTKLLLVKIYHR